MPITMVSRTPGPLRNEDIAIRIRNFKKRCVRYRYLVTFCRNEFKTFACYGVGVIPFSVVCPGECGSLQDCWSRIPHIAIVVWRTEVALVLTTLFGFKELVNTQFICSVSVQCNFCPYNTATQNPQKPALFSGLSVSWNAMNITPGASLWRLNEAWLFVAIVGCKLASSPLKIARSLAAESATYGRLSRKATQLEGSPYTTLLHRGLTPSVIRFAEDSVLKPTLRFGVHLSLRFTRLVAVAEESDDFLVDRENVIKECQKIEHLYGTTSIKDYVRVYVS